MAGAKVGKQKWESSGILAPIDFLGLVFFVGRSRRPMITGPWYDYCKSTLGGLPV